jgi:hypothetical protein
MNIKFCRKSVLPQKFFAAKVFCRKSVLPQKCFAAKAVYKKIRSKLSQHKLPIFSFFKRIKKK